MEFQNLQSGGELFAQVPVKSHFEVVSICEHGSGFRRWLVYMYKSQYGIAPNSEALSQAMAGVFAEAEYEGQVARVHTRIAEHKGCIYLDLANDKWQCVEIAADGYRVLNQSPVYFRRPKGILSLPVPQSGGTLADLQKIINAKEEKDFCLIMAWLVGTLHPRGPYAVLKLNGEAGSVKSKTTELLRRLVDPNEALTRPAPNDIRDAAVAAQNNMVVALDNVSSIPLWLSDVLCRIATGAGYGTRALYTDKEEAIFSACRPIIINGIEDGIVSQGDLLSRTIMVTLKPPDRYKTVEEVESLFDELHPKLLGALLNAASTALRDHNQMQIEELPRLADFAKWVTAAESSLGWQPHTFLDTFTENQGSATSIVVESSPLAQAIIQLMSNTQEWKGYTRELLEALQKYEVLANSKHMPGNARALSGQLQRIAPAMRKQGINIQQLKRDKNGVPIIITKTDQPPNDQNDSEISSSGVANLPPGVANSPPGVANSEGQNSFATPHIGASGDNSSENSPNGVANVAKSSILSRKEVEERGERGKADREGKFATPPTFATPPILHDYATLPADMQADIDVLLVIGEETDYPSLQLNSGTFIVAGLQSWQNQLKHIKDDAIGRARLSKIIELAREHLEASTPQESEALQ